MLLKEINMADLDEVVSPPKRRKLDPETAGECVESDQIVSNVGGNKTLSTETSSNVNENILCTSVSDKIELKSKSNSKEDSSVDVALDINEENEVEAIYHRVHRTELDCGISEYIGSHSGFSGILKQRYSDFLVNERDLEGNTVHLTSYELPPEYVKEKLESSVLSMEAIGKLENLVKEGDKEVKVVVEIEDDKDKRTVIHREIREKFPMLGEL